MDRISLSPRVSPRIRHWMPVACCALATPSWAAVTDLDYVEPGIKPPEAPHTLYESVDGRFGIQGGLALYGFAAATDDINFGASRSIDGAAPTHEDPAWWESVIQPVLTADYAMGEAGSVFGGVQGHYALTRGSGYGDAAGATPGHPEQGRLDRAYLGWRSGAVFADSLGQDALTLSLGRQKFIFGDGFLIGDGYTDIGKYAAYYIGPSEGFENTVVASLDSHGWHADVFHLEADQYVAGGADTRTRLNGSNLEVTLGKRAKFGVAYLDLYDSDTPSRDGMNVYNLRAKGIPLASVPDLALGAQWVHEENDEAGVDADGWYLQGTYTFGDAPWRPQLAYRRAEFDADYDTLFYDFAGGWGNWFMGEIVGEYMLFNSNLDIDMLRFSLQPSDALEVGAIGYHFRYHDRRAAGADSGHFANELNLYGDWTLTSRLSLSAIYGVAFPGDGADERFAGNDDTAQLVELYATYRF